MTSLRTPLSAGNFRHTPLTQMMPSGCREIKRISPYSTATTGTAARPTHATRSGAGLQARMGSLTTLKKKCYLEKLSDARTCKMREAQRRKRRSERRVR